MSLLSPSTPPLQQDPVFHRRRHPLPLRSEAEADRPPPLGPDTASVLPPAYAGFPHELSTDPTFVPCRRCLLRHAERGAAAARPSPRPRVPDLREADGRRERHLEASPAAHTPETSPARRRRGQRPLLWAEEQASRRRRAALSHRTRCGRMGPRRAGGCFLRGTGCPPALAISESTVSATVALTASRRTRARSEPVPAINIDMRSPRQRACSQRSSGRRALSPRRRG
jgi:hypothetical protein